MKIKAVLLVTLVFNLSCYFSQKNPIRDIHVTMEPLNPLSVVADSTTMNNLNGYQVDSIFVDHFQNHDFNLYLSILLNDTSDISGFHVEIGRSNQSKEIADLDVTYDDFSAYDYSREGNFITINIGEYSNVIKVCARVYAIRNNGNSCQPKSIVINNHGNGN